MRFAESMGIERFGAGDGKRVDACYEIYRATREADDPGLPLMPPRVFLGWPQAGFMGEPRETWLLEDAAGIGGWYLLELPDRDNRHLSFLDLAVSPPRQRSGLGTALLRHAAGRATAGGRELLAGLAWAGSPGEAFARSFGAAWGLNEIRRAMDTDALPPERLAALRDEALTAVAREHRGHRLGLRLKLAMLDLLARREPRLRHIMTSNAETNAHMIAINETLGYLVIGRTERSWELPAAQVTQS